MHYTIDQMKDKRVHTCTVCGYETRVKTNMKNHLLAINPCGAYDDPKLVEMKTPMHTHTSFGEALQQSCQ
jgi:hypothetical protein